jgi:hypothetical protein
MFIKDINHIIQRLISLRVNFVNLSISDIYC